MTAEVVRFDGARRLQAEQSLRKGKPRPSAVARWATGLLLILMAATWAALAETDMEVVVTSTFRISEEVSLVNEGDLQLPPEVRAPLAEGWFPTGMLWLYLATNRPVTLTVEGDPYTLELDDEEAALSTQLRGAHGHEDKNDDALSPFGWVDLYAMVDDIDADAPGRYKAWLQLQVLRSGFLDRAGSYTATVTITVSD